MLSVIYLVSNLYTAYGIPSAIVHNVHITNVSIMKLRHVSNINSSILYLSLGLPQYGLSMSQTNDTPFNLQLHSILAPSYFDDRGYPANDNEQPAAFG